jgi:hypothetical protein
MLHPLFDQASFIFTIYQRILTHHRSLLFALLLLCTFHAHTVQPLNKARMIITSFEKRSLHIYVMIISLQVQCPELRIIYLHSGDDIQTRTPLHHCNHDFIRSLYTHIISLHVLTVLTQYPLQVF